MSALSNQSIRLYNRAWEQFFQFTALYNLNKDLPVSVPTISLFLAHLVSISLASSTIATYMSAISYVHKLNDIPDPTNTFIVRKLLSSCRKVNPTTDHRLPITKVLLHRLIEALQHTTISFYDRFLYRAMFTLAFHAFLRVGEMTVTSGATNHNLQRNQVTISPSKLEICFLHYKHSTGTPFTLTVKEQSDRVVCAVHHLNKYIQLRGDSPGPFFAHPPNKAINRSNFSSKLRQAIVFCGLNPAQFKTHSFRIGACTEYVAAGASDSQIRQLGRWKSDAFKRYSRPLLQISAL